MESVAELFEKGGIAMWPLLFLSILSVGTIVERLWFWTRVLTKEKEIVDRVLETARHDWTVAKQISKQARNQPIGRFLYSPLRLERPSPEAFELALESSADEELANMRRGDKILEAVIALSPLLGLFGTVLGLIRSLGSISISDLGTAATTGVTLGIGESLISTAFGLIVAIVSVAFYRLFQVFLFNQVKIFRKSGSELELLYRQFWGIDPPSESPKPAIAPDPPKPSRKPIFKKSDPNSPIEPPIITGPLGETPTQPLGKPVQPPIITGSLGETPTQPLGKPETDTEPKPPTQPLGELLVPETKPIPESTSDSTAPMPLETSVPESIGEPKPESEPESETRPPTDANIGIDVVSQTPPSPNPDREFDDKNS